ncbi:MAG: EAL domain-containing protein [Plesiomonas sp.]|uniref:EAL domain-containing protein n=1 Tax=Plesiomonas sp. TaxID=2486279 RepID=UPI003F412CB4
MLFVISAVFSLGLFSLGVGSLKVTHSNSSWALMQLQMEQQKIESALRLYQAGLVDIDEMYLRYELMWSRFPVLLEGEEAAAIDQVLGADIFLQQYFRDFKSLEPLFNQHIISDQDIVTIRHKIVQNSRGLDRLINQFFHEYRYYQLTGSNSTVLASHLLGISLVISFFLALLCFTLFYQQTRRLERQNQQDILTDLPLRNQLVSTLQHIHYDKQRIGLMLFDLEFFRMINHVSGFDVGDHVLRIMTQSLQAVRPTESQLFRTGDDQFALLLKVNKDTDLPPIVEQLKIKLHTLSDHLPQRTSVLFCCGAAVSNSQRRQETLLKCAELALADAQQQHRTGIVTFSRPLLAHKAERLRALSEMLRHDLEYQVLNLHFQPVLDCTGNDVHLIDVNPRWYHPRFGQISTRELWQLAENNALTDSLSCWMLEKSCQQLRQWHQDFPERELSLCIPISHYLLHPELPALIQSLLMRYSLPAHCLTLQIEGENPSDVMISVLFNLHTMGIKLALGGFGRNPASLVAFQRVSLDFIKIDCALYTDLMRNRKQQILVRGILQIARRLNIKVIFDQINTQKQFVIMSKMLSSNWLQGDHFCRALPAEGINMFILNHPFSNTELSLSCVSAS